jgi:hypothetical protein
MQHILKILFKTYYIYIMRRLNLFIYVGLNKFKRRIMYM